MCSQELAAEIFFRKMVDFREAVFTLIAPTKENVTCSPIIDSQFSSLNDPITHYCIVRTDIPVGVAFANCVHAAGESAGGPVHSGTYAVALSAKSEQDLCSLADHLEARDVPVHRVVEAHGAYADQLMAIGISPGPKSQRGRHLSHVRLLTLEGFTLPIDSEGQELVA